MSAPRRERTLPALWRRTLAGVVDLAAAAAVGAGLLGLGWPDVSRWRPTGELPLIEHVAVTWHATLAWSLSQWMVFWLPLPLWHAAFAGRRSPGAWLAGLVVVGPDGHRASAVRGLVRALAYVSWPATAFVAAALVAVTPTQRGPVEWLSRTWVVLDPSRSHRRARGGGLGWRLRRRSADEA